MCARLLSCPLCSQPGFVTLDGLRAGLVSVATRPLSCPVCNETLLGIDKLTIHLFGHTINANNRNDNSKITEINRNEDSQENNRSDSMIMSQNWNSSGEPRVIREQTQTDEMTNDNITFVPISNLNSARSVTAIVINKNSDSSSNVESQRYSTVSDNMEKSQNQIIFVQNLNHQRQQQYCSPALITTNNSSLTDISNNDNYETSVPMVYHDSTENKSTPIVVASKNCLRENSAQTGLVEEVQIYHGDNTLSNSRLIDSDPKEGTAEQFSETWIENLLQENNEKCNEPCAKSSNGEEKNYHSEIHTNLSDEREKYSNYQNQIDSQDSNVQRSDKTINENHRSSPNSIQVLPQLKALRLLAMKDKIERCNICGIPVPDRNILVLHKQVVHMIAEKDINAMPEELLKNYPCHFCTKVFKNRGSLMVHMRIAHIGYNFGIDVSSLGKDKDGELSCCENGYNCPTCGKNFKKEQHVTQHLKTHEGKQWECDVCSKMFTTKYFLKKHKRLHSGEMPYKCTICDKTFTFQQSYHKHRLYHKDDKPHTCAICGRSFKELSTLHNHERIHTGEKPFVCETCGKCFRQRVSYLVHRRIHTGVMPYKCVACGKNFRYKVSQRTHKCPVQTEDSSPSVSETAQSNTVLPLNSCTDSSTATETNIFIHNQAIPEVSTNENKFILIVNTQGQPILTSESDVRTSFLNEKQNHHEDHKVNHENDNDMWNNLSDDNISKDSTNLPIMKECASNANEKLLTSDENDFFSLVCHMSPLKNDLSTPSTEMEHLRLSSPQTDETRQNHSNDICQTNSTNILQNDLNNAIEGIFRSNNSANNPLETINEESLKQLLYGTDRKV